jgi:hypothetical protein
VCLFVKDHSGEGHKEAKKRLSKFEKNGGVAKVIGISKLRTKYESFEAKRQLCALYDLFLADDRVLPMLPKLIGGWPEGSISHRAARWQWDVPPRAGCCSASAALV